MLAFLRHPARVFRTTALLVLGLGVCEAGAVGEPEALTELRSAFESQLELSVAPLRDAYVRELANLESVRAIREDYEGAIRARDVRERVEGRSSSEKKTEAAGDDEVSGTISLPMDGGLISGNTISYDAIRHALVGFRKARHAVTWNVLKVTPGWFEVIATYGCAESGIEKTERRPRPDVAEPATTKTGGVFAFYEDTNLLKDTSPPLRRTVVPTGSWDKLVTRNIGKLKLTGTTATLKLEAVEPGEDGLMALRSLKLVPSDEPGAGKVEGAVSSEPEGLRELREQYREQVDAELKNRIALYVRELKALEESYTSESKLEAALEARSERMRAQSLLEDPAAVLPKP